MMEHLTRDERVTSKELRRYLQQEQLEEPMRRSILDDLAEDEQYQDEERALWLDGDTDRDH